MRTDEGILHARDRRSLRRAITTPSRVVTDWGLRPLGSRSVDLSLHGMLIASESSSWVGEPVLISFQVPDSDCWLHTYGQVTRIVRGRRRTDREPALGLRFRGFRPAAAAFLAACLDGHPPPPPCRGPRLDYAHTVRTIGAVRPSNDA